MMSTPAILRFRSVLLLSALFVACTTKPGLRSTSTPFIMGSDPPRDMTEPPPILQCEDAALSARAADPGLLAPRSDTEYTAGAGQAAKYKPSQSAECQVKPLSTGSPTVSKVGAETAPAPADSVQVAFELPIAIQPTGAVDWRSIRSAVARRVKAASPDTDLDVLTSQITSAVRAYSPEGSAPGRLVVGVLARVTLMPDGWLCYAVHVKSTPDTEARWVIQASRVP